MGLANVGGGLQGMKVEVVVLNYNGGDLFTSCLPSLLKAVQSSRHETELVILDNGSDDGSDLAAKEFSDEVKLVYASENKILCSYNDYLRESDCDVALLLNNDIRVDEQFIDPLIEYFVKDDDVFMTTSKCLSFDGSKHEGGITRSAMKYGVFWASSRYPGYESDLGAPHYTMAAGYGAFHREKFLALGGYDELYLPGRLEDSDLCFRAWKKGWKLLYEPCSVIYHKGAVSFNQRFGESGTLRMNHRNSFLFVWKNITDKKYVFSHLLLLPLRLLLALVRGQWEFVTGFKDALARLSEALKRRKGLEKSSYSDQEIFEKVANNG